MIICGGDEAGRGALVGPLVIALVSVSQSKAHRFPEIGVRDSKLLSKEKREALYNSIMRIANDVKVDRISSEEINEAMRNNVSLNALEAMHFAALFDKFSDVDVLYLDSPDVIAEKFGMRVNILASRPTRIPGIKSTRKKGTRYTRIIAEHKADSRYPVVSAASIIAKIERDREIEKLSKLFNINIGSGYPSDNKTIGVIKKNMKDVELNRHVRAYWKTLTNIKQTKLLNFPKEL
jgi:ribonuclease HII